jgi:hypothetical protein
MFACRLPNRKVADEIIAILQKILLQLVRNVDRISHTLTLILVCHETTLLSWADGTFPDISNAISPHLLHTLDYYLLKYLISTSDLAHPSIHVLSLILR